jgi:hypothetical protein
MSERLSSAPLPPCLAPQFKPGAIELHPTEDALVVHYEVQEVEAGEGGAAAVRAAAE